jgi:aspartyl-tRNA(Asn)/glutamyl-tRNA(Gln) amidotransferase subunit C
MAISKQDVEHVARLARLALTDDEKNRYTAQLGSILGYIEKLNSVDTEGVPPTAHPWPVANVWREDHTERLQGLEREELLKNAPEREGPFFKVKKVIE